MRTYVLTHLSDGALLSELRTLLTRERTATAAVIAHIAEVDARKLYLPAGFPSMYEYCVGELGLSEEAAYKRIRVGRAARAYPAIFPALADGRLHLSAVILLVPYLTPESAEELLAAAERRTRTEIELFLAQRFPRPDVLTRLEPITPPSAPGVQPHSSGASGSLAPPVETAVLAAFDMPGSIGIPTARPEQTGPCQLSPGTVGTAEPDERRHRIAPLAPERFALQLTIRQEMHDKLRHAQELLSHQIPSGDVAQVLERALDALIRQLERTKCGATSKPRRGANRPREDSRHVPTEVRRAVWKRDEGRCTFVSDQGRRCGARKFLQLDHVEPYARGGNPTISNVRLRCRAHNQYEAQRAFGVRFMSAKREAAANARRGLAQRAEGRDAVARILATL